VSIVNHKSEQIALLETGAFLLVDKGTNPAGAASTVRYGGQVFCFEAFCPQCKVRFHNCHVLFRRDDLSAIDPMPGLMSKIGRETPNSNRLIGMGQP
jgi:hypothetical protein